MFVVSFESFNTHSTEAVATAGDLVGFTKGLKTHRALRFNSFWWLFIELTSKSLITFDSLLALS